MRAAPAIPFFLCLASWASAASKNPAKVTKRGIYDDSSFYGTHGVLATDSNGQSFNFLKHPQLITLPSGNSQAFVPEDHQFSSYGLNGASLKAYENFFTQSHPSDFSFQPLPASAWNVGVQPAGYGYPQPQGLQFLEEPVPRFFDYTIPSALPPRPPQGKIDASGRRVISPLYDNLQYTAIPSEPAITVRLPIGDARPTRIVVPQHGAVAMGSGGLGYRTLPGGRIVMGSGSRSFANLAMARARPLPPMQPPPNQFSFPNNFLIQQRSFDSSESFDPAAPSSNSLTVFPQTNDPLTVALANSG